MGNSLLTSCSAQILPIKQVFVCWREKGMNWCPSWLLLAFSMDLSYPRSGTSASVHQVLNVPGQGLVLRKLKEIGGTAQLPSPALQPSCSTEQWDYTRNQLPHLDNLYLAGGGIGEWVLSVWLLPPTQHMPSTAWSCTKWDLPVFTSCKIHPKQLFSFKELICHSAAGPLRAVPTQGRAVRAQVQSLS